jgi:hypothetical protein
MAQLFKCDIKTSQSVLDHIQTITTVNYSEQFFDQLQFNQLNQSGRGPSFKFLSKTGKQTDWSLCVFNYLIFYGFPNLT